jgi:hypothetical protein
MDQSIALAQEVHRFSTILPLPRGCVFAHPYAKALATLLLALSAAGLTAAPGDENWDDRFLPPGGNVHPPIAPILVHGIEVYAGGTFSFTNGQSIARWDGFSWSPLGAGITNGTVTALAMNGNDLYVGGRFTNAGGLSAYNIARWDGKEWFALDSGVTNASGIESTPPVMAILADGGNVYVAGNFTSAGGASATNIARWDGVSWSALDSGLTRTDNSGYALALAMINSDLYAAGGFTIAGGIPATNVARWNGSNWSPLGSGVGAGTGSSLSDIGRVNALAAIGDTLFVAGNFLTAGGLEATNIAQWNGSSWSDLDGGVNRDGQITTLVANGTDLYVGGNIKTAGTNTVSGFAKWNTRWWPAETNLTGRVEGIAVSGGGELYLSGFFNTIGGVTVNGIARFDGTHWRALGEGLNSSVNAITVKGPNVYVGGRFSLAGGVAVTNIARWDGSYWSELGPGLNGTVVTLGANNANLYAGGNFTKAGDLIVNHIARWDGDSWSALGSGLDNGINTLAVNGTDVYVGGFFSTAGGAPIGNIAKWDGAAWSALGTGVSPPGLGGIVTAIAFSGSDVYVGGGFTFAGGVATPSGVAKWDGNKWTPVGSATDINPNGVSAMAINGSDLYISGNFVRIGKLNANHIARWDGNSWSAVGTGLSAYSPSLAFIGHELYATGSFITAGGITVNRIARCVGTNWFNLGSGFPLGSGQALAVKGTDLYVGGDFTKAGVFPSIDFAIWHKPRPREGLSFSPTGCRTITWSSEPGEFYQVLSTTDVAQPFTPVSGIIPSEGFITSYTDCSAASSERYYDIQELL